MNSAKPDVLTDFTLVIKDFTFAFSLSDDTNETSINILSLNRVISSEDTTKRHW